MTKMLPKSLGKLLERLPVESRHPGLQLDKFSAAGDQKAQRDALDAVVEANSGAAKSSDYAARYQRWQQTLHAVGARTFEATTTTPLTLHLSRATALENAGLSLHPVYGFAYLPGGGLKGLARAYAETVWLPAQPDPATAWRTIEDVFGWAPNPERRQRIQDQRHPARRRYAAYYDEADPNAPEITAQVGGVIFYDAWPKVWPTLLLDIVNNHHPDYYQPPGKDKPYAPGDWEAPRPVYFLAVAPQATFLFALAKRRADVADALVAQAQEWLRGGLCTLGVGAKTNAGYGVFRPLEGGRPDVVAPETEVFETTLTLTTPAFLAGARQQAEDCDLRAATLRGQLRWWWRTLHAGSLDANQLRALEAALWGDTAAGGAVKIVVEPVGGSKTHPYEKRNKAHFSEEQKTGDYGIPSKNSGRDRNKERAKKITQGLWYVSYGMDESKGRRYYLEPGAQWRLRLIARPTAFYPDRKALSDPKADAQRAGRAISAAQVMAQAKAALWLLCHFGGVGAKARKGFGSLTTPDLNDHNLDGCKQTAQKLRAALGLPTQFVQTRAQSSALEQMLPVVEVGFNWPDIWQVLDQVGFAYQAFAKQYAHKLEKKALGLPRKIPPPCQGAFKPLSPVEDRHASPVHIHLDRRDERWLVRVTAFPAAKLPNLTDSQSFLKEFLKEVERDLQRRAALPPPLQTGNQHRPPTAQPAHQGGAVPLASAAALEQPASPAFPKSPKSGEQVEAVLLEERTKKGGWKAKHEPSGLSGPIQNSDAVPGDKQPGDRLTLIVASANEREIAFKFPTEAELQRAAKVQTSPPHKGGKPSRGVR
ncbi:MAG: type III-B CRISPR module RAMP protein Cmr6 [Chloracidobacterium sp.]|nr:type III-B CRISPR module RAMP protein Cmr6 [Chloracidobacterium sp.]MDW8218689.1 type III-B CRISPR module RAMP protein Cmr6 [Acidobacteriota bacterium]